MEILKEFIFENKPTESCHASTVLPLDDGRVVVAWFAGTKESADDVDILTSVRSEGGWSEPVRVSADRNIPHWNPVLFRRTDGKIMLFFKVGKKIPMWKTYFSLSDNGVDWSEPAELVPGDISGGRGPVKNKPIRLRSGRVIAPPRMREIRSGSALLISRMTTAAPGSGCASCRQSRSGAFMSR